MRIGTNMKMHLTMAIVLFGIILGGCSQQESPATDDFEKQVEDYLKKYSYQTTYNYAMQYTAGDPAKFNVWAQSKAALIKAGEDKVVRTNNDTFYKIAFVLLEEGPVVLESSETADDRFYSFQLMDDRNTNYQNVIHPKGKYTLYYGEKPKQIEGEAIEVPSKLSVVIVRVEVKNKNDADDMAAATKLFNGITISGPIIAEFPKLDLLSGFDKKVVDEAHKRMDEAMVTTEFSKMIATPKDVPGKVSYLLLAAGSKGGWGGPVTSHSSYESFYTDAEGKELKGSNGTYTITTEAPPVDAFWSVTVYDSESQRLHPNKDDRYHINNTTALPNEDGTYTFIFKTECGPEDRNCLEVPAGRFDIAARYYLPREPILSGQWKMPKPKLKIK